MNNLLSAVFAIYELMKYLLSVVDMRLIKYLLSAVGSALMELPTQQ